MSIVLYFGLLIIAITVHEFAHGWTAFRLGDPTAKFSGRLTLNPLAHIDPVGTVLLPLFLFIATRGQFVFGAAKPVPINYLALKNPKRDIIFIGASGPATNLLLAVIVSLIRRAVPEATVLDLLLANLIFVNIILGVFNLIPIPPLDGSRILMGMLPKGIASKYASLERFGFFIVMLLVAIGAFDVVVWPVVKLIAGLLLSPQLAAL